MLVSSLSRSSVDCLTSADIIAESDLCSEAQTHWALAPTLNSSTGEKKFRVQRERERDLRIDNRDPFGYGKAGGGAFQSQALFRQQKHQLMEPLRLLLHLLRQGWRQPLIVYMHFCSLLLLLNEPTSRQLSVLLPNLRTSSLTLKSSRTPVSPWIPNTSTYWNSN